MWYDKQAVLSYNRILNFVLSNRGGGKTFNMTCWCIDDFLKTKRQAVWVRRNANQLRGDKDAPGILDDNRFFSAVQKEGKYPDVKLEIKGNVGYINDEPAITFVALSTSRRKLKSMNLPYVNKIIFDEFIEDNGYLKDEVEIFLDLFESVARLRDNVRAVLLANSISVVNPYFLYFDVKPKSDSRFTVTDDICIEMFTDDEFIEAKNKTRFGRLIRGTRYGEYAVNNKWLLDNETFIESKTPRAEFMLGMKYNGVMYGFWVDYRVGFIYVNKQYDPSSYSLYCLQRDDHETNLLLIKSISESKLVQRVVYAFRNGLLRFEDMSVKNQFYELIGLFVR